MPTTTELFPEIHTKKKETEKVVCVKGAKSI